MHLESQHESAGFARQSLACTSSRVRCSLCGVGFYVPGAACCDPFRNHERHAVAPAAKRARLSTWMAQPACWLTGTTNGGYIHNDGRRCGRTRYPGSVTDRSSPMCRGSTDHGELENISQAEVQARCLADARCQGYWSRHHRNKLAGRADHYYRPVVSWVEGARFTLGSWTGVRKECTGDRSRAAAYFPPPPWPALILSSSLQRFARAAAVANALGFRSTYLAAAFPPPGESQVCGIQYRTLPAG